MYVLEEKYKTFMIKMVFKTPNGATPEFPTLSTLFIATRTLGVENSGVRLTQQIIKCIKNCRDKDGR